MSINRVYTMVYNIKSMMVVHIKKRHPVQLRLRHLWHICYVYYIHAYIIYIYIKYLHALGCIICLLYTSDAADE